MRIQLFDFSTLEFAMALLHPLPPIPLEQLDSALADGRDSWEQGRNARILLTGGTGFVGTWLLELFCRANQVFDLRAEIWVLTRDPEGFLGRSPQLANKEGVHLFKGDVRTFLAGGLAFSHVIHGAASSSGPFAETSPLGHLDTIVQGTRRALEVSVSAGAKRFLYLSSGAVYGPQPPDLEWMAETYLGAPDPLSPDTCYAQGKRMGEHLCAHFTQQHGFSTVSARGFAFVGPHLPLNAHFAIGNFIRDGLKGGPIMVKSDGTPFRSYLYGSDMARCLWLLLFEGRSGLAYNVGSDQGIQLGDLARMVGQQLSVEVQILGQAEPGKPPLRYVPSIARIRQEFGFEIKVGLAESLRCTSSWHKS